jgi:hypothetical protein
MYCGNTRHVEKHHWKKRDNLEAKVKKLKGDMSTFCESTNNFTFQVRTSQAYLSHTYKNEWVVDFGCTHHATKDVSLFSSLDKVVE